MAQINKPSDYFNTVLYTGDGTSSQPQTGVGFQPDWVWIKIRSTTGGHGLYDVIRGATERLRSDSNNAESTATDGLTSFDSDGFTVGNNSSTGTSSETYASWNWLADNTSGSSNTDGSITSTVSANTTSGFSIVTYSGNSTAGATVGHGLGATPGMIIVKGRDAVINWQVYHQAIGNTNYLELDTTDASTASSARWNNTTPTSTVFTLGTGTGVNAGFDYVAYCFAEKKGFSKFGSYTGNGNSDGTFVYTGFKPAFLIRKRTDSAVAWYLHDNKRDGYNVTQKWLSPNDSDAESTTQVELRVDFLSNGFKMRDPNGAANASGGSYIYMAFAENPLVGTNNIPATAR